MLTLNNVTTADDYTDANTISDQQADLLDILVSGAAIYARLRPYDAERQNLLEWRDEIFLGPGAKLYDGVAGLEVRSAVAAQPAQVAAALFGPGDPRPSSAADVGFVLSADGSVSPQAGGSLNAATGSMLPYAGDPTAGVPSGWLYCDGSAVSRATYAALFAVIGTFYGTGDGSTTFNLPDARGRVLVASAAGGNVDVESIGATDSAAYAHRRPKHRHSPHSHTTADSLLKSSGGSTGWSFTGGPYEFVQDPTTSVDGGSGNSSDPLDAPAYLVIGGQIIKT